MARPGGGRVEGLGFIGSKLSSQLKPHDLLVPVPGGVIAGNEGGGGGFSKKPCPILQVASHVHRILKKAHCFQHVSGQLRSCRLHRTFTGFPVLGVQWQKMESKVLRDAYKLSKTRKGVLVRKLEPIMDSAKKLKPYDVIMKFDGIQIASDGTVPFRYIPQILNPDL